LAGLAKIEAETIRERTQSGLQAARVRGRTGGRPPLDKSKVEMALLLYDSRKYTIKEITKRFPAKIPSTAFGIIAVTRGGDFCYRLGAIPFKILASKLKVHYAHYHEHSV
jgi:hypothetical protein